MFGLSELKQTIVYQEAFQEGLQEGRQEGLQEGEIVGKLAAVRPMLALGASAEQIAEALGLDIEEVRKAAQQQSGN